VITATKVTTGSVDDGDMLEEMIEQVEGNTGQKVEVAVGDSR
jgi:ABC-type tungstate transport system permease subunit